MRRALIAVLSGALVLACSDDDADTSTDPTEAATESEDGRFCDVYLEYLADESPATRTAVADAADDPTVGDYVKTIETSTDPTELLAATLDLDDLARTRCQPEWTAGAQGAGNTAAAAQAFLDAVIAGDPLGARNVASANAIAVFEPWDARPVDDEGIPALGDVDDGSFSLVLGPATLAECQVETGVVVTCRIAE